jgi:hypothetical protein
MSKVPVFSTVGPKYLHPTGRPMVLTDVAPTGLGNSSAADSTYISRLTALWENRTAIPNAGFRSNAAAL